MDIKTFITEFGIEALNNKEIIYSGKKYKISLSEHDLEYHSIQNPDWGESQERLNAYHEKGNFRFYAKNEKDMCVWVYPTTELHTEETNESGLSPAQLLEQRNELLEEAVSHKNLLEWLIDNYGDLGKHMISKASLQMDLARCEKLIQKATQP